MNKLKGVLNSLIWQLIFLFVAATAVVGFAVMRFFTTPRFGSRGSCNLHDILLLVAAGILLGGIFVCMIFGFNPFLK